MADYQFIQSTGVIVPDTADLLADVQTEFRQAFGEDLIVTTDTPQGVQIAAETEARDAVARNNADLANQINPDLAGGIFLDALWALMGGARVKATRTLVPGVVLSGVPGTIIPALSQARIGSDYFETLAAVTLSPSGTVTTTMRAVAYGPVAAPVGQLTQIASSVLGWEGVTNPNAAILGIAREGDIPARRRRRKTLAIQGVGTVQAIYSRLNDIEGVVDALVRENYDNVPKVVDGVTLKANSVYAVVYGGSDLDVATSLLRSKSAGAGWNGATVVSVTEPSSSQIYDVQFDRPTPVPIWARFTVKVGTATVSPQVAVRAAAVAYANGEIDGEDGFLIGSDVSPFELAGAVSLMNPGLYVQKVELSTDGAAYSTSEVPVSIQQIATLTEGRVSVVVAQ